MECLYKLINVSYVVMKVCAENLLPVASAAPQAQCLFHQLKQIWPLDQELLLHAQVLLLQSQLASFLAPDQSPLQLAQEALAQVQVGGPVFDQSRCQSILTQLW